MEAKPKILILLRYYLPGYKSGGPVKSVSNMVNDLSDDFDIYIVTLNKDHLSMETYPDIKSDAWTKKKNQKIYYLSESNLNIKTVWGIIKSTRPDYLYLNSFWDRNFSIFPLLISKFSRSFSSHVILAPRGELSSGALRNKPLKKRMALSLISWLRLHKGITWHATSSLEQNDIKSLFHDANIRLAKNSSVLVNTTKLQDDISNVSELKICFLSRIHQKKNLSYALSIVQKIETPCKFNIYGPVDDKKEWSRCKSLIKAMQPHISVEYHGAIKPEFVHEQLAKNHIFLFPSKGENYGHVIFEALNAGCYVITSDQVPWPTLEVNGIGIQIPLSKPQHYKIAIDNFTKKLPLERAQIRQKALNFCKGISEGEWKFDYRDLFKI